MKKLYNEIIKNNYINNILINNYNINNINQFISNDVIKKKFDFDNNYDKKKCYLEFNSNLGGKDSEQIIEFFYNFYKKWFFYKKINIDLLELDSSNYGYKKFLFYIKENFSYFLFKKESGIHRIIRKNPLITSNKIQTSYISVNVFPILESECIFNINDILIDTYKSKGAGGQHVNTTNSAIRITHIPTNTIVCCQSERSQIKNKKTAIKILEYKILIKNKNLLNKYEKKFSESNRYIKTYYFENNEIIDHINKKKYNLSNFFNCKYDFLNI